MWLRNMQIPQTIFKFHVSIFIVKGDKNRSHDTMLRDEGHEHDLSEWMWALCWEWLLYFGIVAEGIFLCGFVISKHV